MDFQATDSGLISKKIIDKLRRIGNLVRNLTYPVSARHKIKKSKLLKLH